MSASAESSRTPLLRDGALAGVAMLIAHASGEHGGDGSLAQAAHATCADLGADVAELSCSAQEPGEQELAAAVARAFAGADATRMLIVDGDGLFAQARAETAGTEADRERAGLLDSLSVSWHVTQAVVAGSWLEGGTGGRICYLAPRSSRVDGAARTHAACAGLENLARTLSIEWARHAITPVTIAPGEHTDARDVAGLLAYLASPAGAYFSGCLLDLRGSPGA